MLTTRVLRIHSLPAWVRRTLLLCAAALPVALAALHAHGLPERTTSSPPDVICSLAPARDCSSLDEPLRLLGEARQSFREVRDYACMFLKRERLGGEVRPENVIALKVRNEPFSVHMQWLGPKEFAGQEACYVTGRHDGRMRARSAGVLGALGFLTLEPRDPRVMANNRHDITEAGLGNLIERLALRWEAERRLNKTQAALGECDWNDRRCTRIETVHPPSERPEFYSHRNVLYLDQQTRLPIRVEVYGRPRASGLPEGELLECYCYHDLRLNVGLGEEAFAR